MVNYCKCGCGAKVRGLYVSGHNLRNLYRSKSHGKKISIAQKEAWKTKRKRKPIGSTNHDCNGYIRVKVVEGSGRWITQHILVMENHIGRKLRLGECVHHINGIKVDNRIENLFLCESHRQHQLLEDSLRIIACEFVADGLIKFKEGKYERIL